MSGYKDVDCINCGRHRVEEDGVCEKCNYDQGKREYVSALKKKNQVEVKVTARVKPGFVLKSDVILLVGRIGKVMDGLRGYLPWHLVHSAVELGERARIEISRGAKAAAPMEELTLEELERTREELQGMQAALGRMNRAIERMIRERLAE